MPRSLANFTLGPPTLENANTAHHMSNIGHAIMTHTGSVTAPARPKGREPGHPITNRCQRVAPTAKVDHWSPKSRNRSQDAASPSLSNGGYVGVAARQNKRLPA